MVGSPPMVEEPQPPETLSARHVEEPEPGAAGSGSSTLDRLTRASGGDVEHAARVLSAITRETPSWPNVQQ